MRLNSLALVDFRNYRHIDAVLSPTVNAFVGRNAQGKTNLLEAVYLLALGRSFRTRNEKELARYGKNGFRLLGRFSNQAGVKLDIEYAYGPNGKMIRQNGLSLRRTSDLFGRVQVVLFSPDDLHILKGGPEYRRSYLDLHLGQTSQDYRRATIKFHRLLTQRNEMLRRIREGEAERSELIVWNESLIELGTIIAKYRMNALQILTPLITNYHTKLSGGNEEVNLAYRLGGKELIMSPDDITERIKVELAAREREEIARGITVVGPHRDDIEINFSSGHNLRSFGSQGQQRTAALSMKLAAVDYLQTETKESPMLLLDDVLSEFDNDRKTALLNLLCESNQILITATDAETISGLPGKVKIFRIDQGGLEAVMP